ncbi:MAG: hypothetical protein BRC55_07795, partial [Cyanobacteria bacterium SW_8_48_13]
MKSLPARKQRRGLTTVVYSATLTGQLPRGGKKASSAGWATPQNQPSQNAKIKKKRRVHCLQRVRLKLPRTL